MQAPKPTTNWQIESQQQAAGAQQIKQIQQNVGTDNANLLRMFGQSRAPQGVGLSTPSLVGAAPAASGAAFGAIPSLASLFGGRK
jgi:hypothetical protein